MTSPWYGERPARFTHPNSSGGGRRMSGNPYDFTPAQIAKYDQWYAGKCELLDELMDKMRADIANGPPVGLAEEAALLTGALRSSPTSTAAFVCDLLAVLLVRTVRPDATGE